MNTNALRETMDAEARKLNGARAGVPVRHMDFVHPAEKNRFVFYDQNPLATSLFAVFSAIFPPGERFFVESVRRFRDQLTDETLRAKVSGFIGQESIHGREHERLNEWFVAHGFDMAMPDRMIRFSLGLLERLPASQQLACTTFMEHFTAHLAEAWLTDTRFRTGADPEMLRLWSWHALEELEHKEVAFDVHREVSRHEHLERVLAGPLVIAALFPGIAFSLVWLVVKQGEAFSIREHLRGLGALLGRKGFLTNILPKMPAFMKTRFHPDEHDTRAIEKEWRERLFGTGGELNAMFRNREAVERASASA